MKTIYLYILDTMADWETGLVIAELNTQRFFKAPQDWQVKTWALTKKAIVTLGGMTIVPDHTINEFAADHAVLLILPYLTMFCSSYKGTKYYQDELAVTDGNLITAGSSAQTAFAYHILKKLDVLEQKNLDYWYAYFENHSTEDFLKLYQAIIQNHRISQS